MTNENIKQKLKEILGDEAYNNDMKVPINISKLVKSVNYLTTQLNIIKSLCDDDQPFDVDGIIEQLEDILK